MSAHETVTEVARRKDLAAFRLVMVAFAVCSVVAGAVVGFAPDILSLTADQALNIASVLLVVGIVDTVVLLQWGRLFGTAGMDVARPDGHQ